MADKITLQFECHPHLFHLIRNVLGTMTAAFGGNENDAMGIKTAVTELLSNAYRHAYGNRPGPVELEVEADGTAINLTITNHGQSPSERLTIPNESDGRKSVGLHLVGRLVDAVAITHPVEGGRGVRVQLLRKISKT